MYKIQNHRILRAGLFRKMTSYILQINYKIDFTLIVKINHTFNNDFCNLIKFNVLIKLI